MPTVAIVGLGLIGGSLARAIAPHHHVIGVDPHGPTRDAALAAGAVVEALAKPGPELGAADLVVLAGPLGTLPRLLEAVAPHVGPDTLVTDVGSAKVPIVEAGRKALPGRFVGGHPMAGTEHQGFVAGHEGLFRGAPWVLVAEDDAEAALADRVEALLSPVGARWVRMAADEHDASVALVSHLPLLMATVLARTVQDAEKQHGGLPRVRQVAGSGFRDTTRLAAGNPRLAADICKANRAAILPALYRVRHALAQLEVLLGDGLDTPLEMLFEEVSAWKRS